MADVKAILERTANQEMSESDVDELKAAKEKLMNSAQNLFTKMYENMQGATAEQAGPDMGGFEGGFDGGAADAGATESAPEEDVIDGDFREV